MPDDPEYGVDTEEVPTLADPTIFCMAATVCIIVGLILGYACAWLFYVTSHVCESWGCYTVPIPTKWGIIFILIIAATALCIAVTFRVVPEWVRNYMIDHELPGWVIWVKARISNFNKYLMEKP